MDAELVEFTETWKRRNKNAGEPEAIRAEARDLALKYLASHSGMALRYGALGLPALVALIDAARARGDHDTVVQVDMWLLVHHEPQRIGGTVKLGA